MRKILAVVVLLVVVITAVVLLDPSQSLMGRLRGEKFYQGRPTSSWNKALRSKDPAEREEARSSLTAEDGSSVDVLAELLQFEEGADWDTAEVRWVAAEILGEIGPAAAATAPLMIQRLEDSDAHVRSVAAKSLPAISTPADTAVPALIGLMDREPSVVAARALSEYGEDAGPSVELLIEVLNRQELPTEVRWNAARTLGKIRENATAAIPTLIEHVSAEEATIREHSAEALGDIGPLAKAGIPVLIEALKDPAVRVRRDSARSLGQIGPAAKVAVPNLLPLLEDPEAIVRDATRTAIKLLDPEQKLPEPKDKDKDKDKDKN